MKTRMERYSNDQEQSVRTKKNQELYSDLYNNTVPSSNVAVLDNNNESEIDISKIKELVQNREGYKRVKDFESIIKTPTEEDNKENYDIYEDMDNKIYDINTILEEAKSKREPSEREKYRSLKNTQYNILTKLNLNEETEPEEMVKDFFTQDKTIKNLMTEAEDELNKENEKTRSQTKTSLDLFDSLKGSDTDTIIEPIKEEKSRVQSKDDEEEDNTFYTNHMSFTKEDFEDFQNLQTTVKKNNRLIKVFISVLVIILIVIIAFLIFAIL